MSSSLNNYAEGSRQDSRPSHSQIYSHISVDTQGFSFPTSVPELRDEMQAINIRLKELEDLESHYYHERQKAIQYRSHEDEMVYLKRRTEDEDYLELLKKRDQEEDVCKLPVTLYWQCLKEQRHHSSRRY